MTTEAPATNPAAPYGRLIPLRVHWDELDALGMLHNSRYPLLVERAWLDLWQQDGFRPDGSDAFHVVKELQITYELPVTGPGAYAVHLWLERLGSASLAYGFRFCRTDGSVTHAYGTRTLIHLDPNTLRPSPWSEQFKTAGQALLRPSE